MIMNNRIFSFTLLLLILSLCFGSCHLFQKNEEQKLLSLYELLPGQQDLSNPTKEDKINYLMNEFPKIVDQSNWYQKNLTLSYVDKTQPIDTTNGIRILDRYQSHSRYGNNTDAVDIQFDSLLSAINTMAIYGNKDYDKFGVVAFFSLLDDSIGYVHLGMLKRDNPVRYEELIAQETSDTRIVNKYYEDKISFVLKVTYRDTLLKHTENVNIPGQGLKKVATWYNYGNLCPPECPK